MKLGLKEIKEITQGTEKIFFDEEGYVFFRFTDEEAEVTDNLNHRATAGVLMEFFTDAKQLALDVLVKKVMEIRSYFSIEFFLNDKKLGDIKNFEDREAIGNYVEKNYPTGEFSKKFDLGDGEKKVKIVLPHSVIVKIKNIEITDATFISPVKREKKLLAYGDSITQGFDSLYPTESYAMRLAQMLDVELINKGIGGEVFCPALVCATKDVKPDYVIVAYGTNDWSSSDKETFLKNSQEFISKVSEKFSDITVFLITPIWRKDCDGIKKVGRFEEVEKMLMTECDKYENMVAISGINLVPHEEGFFGDLRLHPNNFGFEHYAKNLKAEIERKTV